MNKEHGFFLFNMITIIQVFSKMIIYFLLSVISFPTPFFLNSNEGEY